MNASGALKPHGKQCKSQLGCNCSLEMVLPLESMWVSRVDPLKFKRSAPNPLDLIDDEVVIWVPDVYYNRSIKHMPCPNCRDYSKQHVTVARWIQVTLYMA